MLIVDIWEKLFLCHLQYFMLIMLCTETGKEICFGQITNSSGPIWKLGICALIFNSDHAFVLPLELHALLNVISIYSSRRCMTEKEKYSSCNLSLIVTYFYLGITFPFCECMLDKTSVLEVVFFRIYRMFSKTNIPHFLEDVSEDGNGRQVIFHRAVNGPAKHYAFRCEVLGSHGNP